MTETHRHPAGTPAETPAEGTDRPALAPALLVAAIFLAALNLRAALSSVPPLVHTIQRDLGLSSATAGLLTTAPVLCMGLFAPVAQRLAHSVGRAATVAVALALLVAGLLLRLGGGSFPVLLVATLLPGVGIALAGTVLPGIVKEFFPGRSGAMTGVYLLAMMVGATAASALAVPLADTLGSWQRSLAVWSALAVVGLLAWLPVVRRADRGRPHDPAAAAPPTPPTPPLAGARVALPWRSPTARLLAAFMAMQSVGFYTQLAWIPPSYESRGWSARDAGLLLAVWSIVQLASGVGGPALADRFRDRRPLLAAALSLTVVGTLGVALVPTTAPWLWVALMGLGQGSGFSLGLVKLVDYAPTPAASARLSAMVFLFSYSLASVGPFLFGAVRDATDSFAIPFGALVVVAVVQLGLVPRLRPGRTTEPAG